MTEINITKKEQKELFFKALFGSPFFNIFASVLATFVVGAIFLKFGGGVPISVTQTTTEKGSTFDMTGEGRAVVVPDEARLTLGVREEASSVSTAQDRANSTMNNLTSRLKEIGVSEEMIQTSGYNVYPNYNESRISGYVVSTDVTVRFTDFSRVNQALDLIGELGLTQVGGLRFTLSDQKREEAFDEARSEAVSQAKEKAESLAKLAGMKLGRIVNVSENVGNTPGEIMPLARQDTLELSESTSVEPGTSEVVLTVTLSYETL